MNAIDSQFRRLRSEGRKAFIPFVTAGDPSLEATEAFVHELVRRGAHLVEIGFPYSDPIADGAVIQASYTRALQGGLKMEAVYGMIRRLADSPELRDTPLVAMISYSLVHRRGHEAFIAQAQQAGLSGAIVPDLPVEESDAVARFSAERGFKLIQLVTPTTPRERAIRIAQVSSGFLYCVSVTGITGERAQLPRELLDQLAWLRTQTHLPLCVGFGISRAEHVRMLRDMVDGVIVGSALVRRIEQANGKSIPEVARDIGDLAGSLVDALQPGQ